MRRIVGYLVVEIQGGTISVSVIIYFATCSACLEANKHRYLPGCWVTDKTARAWTDASAPH